MRSSGGDNQTPDPNAPSRMDFGHETNRFPERVSSDATDDIRKLRLLAEIYERTGNWEKSAETSERLCNLEPDNVSWWIMRAIALDRKTGDAFAVREVLFAALQHFPADSVILYNLACCSCRMEDFTAAWDFLERTYGTSDKRQIKRLVGEEPQLELLWENENQST